MVQDRLLIELDKVASRFRRLWERQTYSATLLVCSLLTILAASAGVSFVQGSRAANAAFIALAALLGVSVLLRSRFLVPDRNWIARQIEDKFPELNSCLLTAVEQSPSLANGRYGFLQTSVISDALEHAALRDWSKVVSRRRMGLAVVSNLATFVLMICAVMFASRPLQPTVAGIHKGDPRQAAAAGSAFSVAVEPGDTEIERGNSLLVLARVQGPLPADATLVYQPAGSDATRLPMSASLDDPIFGGRVSAVTQPFEYHVELGGHVTPTYHVTVFEYPRLERADARLAYPSYTGLEERLIQDIRTISVVEGTSVTLICQLNKPVKSARFVDSSHTPTSKDAQEKPIPSTSGLVLTQREGSIYEAQFTAATTRRLKLELVDESGRMNTEQALIVVQVVPNQPPTLKLVAPGRDLEVSPLEELDVKATAWDDYGVKRMGVSFGLAGSPPTDVVLGENAAARQKHELANLIRFEDLNAEPDQLLAYHFWAEDFGPDGTLRRTSSDMFFAEVRHFDEIFRQGQQPPGGQQQQRQQQQNSQAGQQAQQLAQLQKDIINATWKLLRREISPKPTAPFVEDVKQIADSQSTALEQADALGENVQDAQSQSHLLAVLEAMQQAVKHLKAAHDQPAPAPLQPALAAEQQAYQALLKLRAREHEVVRQQQQQSSSSSSSQSARSQQQRQQMQQLDLKSEENRYETQRLAQAQQPETPEDRETRQVLNRLKELARRQHDLNERLKDLQSALQEAQNEQKKEEIRQQLKRLQDEQRDVLRDTDELQARMETPENQERMAEERQQLEQARDQVQRTSESLDKDEVTQAAASGTRAEREFEELRNEFRRQSSGRFNEEMKEMRDAARELDQKEKELSEKLTQSAEPDRADQKKKSLRDDNSAEQIAQGLNEQKARLSTLTQRLQETVQEAEQTEPLLSERLNDAARNLQDQKVEQALDAAGRSLQRGLLEDARQVEQIANKGIGQLKEGIEKAAEAVLGDETEALRRAREQLQNLARELNQEIARNAPDEAAKLPADRERAVARESNRDPNGETAGGQPRDSEQDPNGERQQSEQPGQSAEDGQSRKQSREGTGERPQAGQERKAQRQTGGEQNGERQPEQSQEGESQPGQQPGQQPGRKQQPGQQQRGQPGQGQPQTGERQPGESQPGDQPMPQGEGQGQGQPQQGQPGQQQGQQPGEPGQTGQQGQRGQNPQGRQQGNQRGGQRGGAQRLGDPNPQGPQEGGRFTEGGGQREFSPLSGQDFLEWSDRLRDVEEMVDDPELRAEAARIRDQARSLRAEMKRHSTTPNWNLVRVNVAEPLAELANRVADELVRRNSKQAIVPLDRDPVPPKYSEKTRKYYERLGSGQ